MCANTPNKESPVIQKLVLLSLISIVKSLRKLTTEHFQTGLLQKEVKSRAESDS